MLFLHMHGPHPAGHQMQIHHNVMGTLPLAGGLVWFAANGSIALFGQRQLFPIKKAGPSSKSSGLLRSSSLGASFYSIPSRKS